MPDKTIKIFLASSGTLKEERNAIDAFISSENRQLNGNGIFLHLVIWEELSKSFRGERIQDYFNREMLGCEVVIALFFDRAGQFTLEEFETAYRSLKSGGNPRYLYVYFKKAAVDIDTVDPEELGKIRALKKRIEGMEQIYCPYTSIADLQLQIKRQLDQVIASLALHPSATGPAVPSPASPKPAPCLADYLKHCLQKNRHLSMHGFETTLRMPIELERVYVHMRANVGGSKAFRDDCIDARHEHDIGQLDIKGAFAASDRLRVKDIIILGNPGSGKTTLLKFILVMLIEKKAADKLGLPENLIPFLAPLRDLRDPRLETFEQFLVRVCKCDDHHIEESVITGYLRKGNAVVLLDGLDEVANEELRVETCRWIDEARGRYVNTRFILTSRFTGYLGKVRLSEPAVLELSIQNFTPDESQAFLERWFETVEVAMTGGDESVADRGRQKGAALASDIRKDTAGHLQKLAVNPLLLQIIALVRFDRGTALPERRVELYQECTEVLLEKWDMAKGLPVLLTAKQAREILQPVALWLHQVEERRSATLPALRDIVAAALADIGKSKIDPDALLLNIRDRSGIFMGYGTDEYGFTHLSFQEYLSAEQVRNDGLTALLIENYGVKWWREVTLLALSLNNPSIIEPFMRAIVADEKFTHDTTVVVDGIRDSIKKPVEVFIETVGNETLAREARLNAISIMAEMVDERVVRCLQETAGYSDKPIAQAAYTALVKLGRGGDVAEPWEEKPARIRSDKDNAEMVLVPAGTFLYGSREDDPEAQSNEKPQQSLYVPDFYISIYPVTNAQYKKFVDETGHRPPDKVDYEWAGKPVWKGSSFPPDKANHPVVCVSCKDAEAYATWAGLRLPGEVEWEKAARGIDGRMYPWGENFKKELCNSDGRFNGTTPVGKFERGKSPFGCHDMAGNVWEWCADWYGEDNDKGKLKEMLKGSDSGDGRVLRGGSWGNSWNYLRCAVRGRYYPDSRNNLVGFRCVR